MKIKCEYCDSYIEDTQETCPNCGGVNNNMMRSADGIPKTIEELKAFAVRENLPLEDMRFFLGENYQQPKAYGIYRDDDGNFVVYKNKANGERAVRYRGTDEAYAVNEIYQKMRTEFLQQRALNIGKTSNMSSTERKQAAYSSVQTPMSKKQKRRQRDNVVTYIIIGIIIAMLISSFLFSCVRGVYSFGGRHYYHDHYDGGYYYDDSDYDYYDDYDDGYDSWNDDWDDDDWDSGGFDWDSGGSDWDSDW